MDHPSAPGPITNFQHPQDATFSAPAQLARGRQARDPQAKTVTYNVASLEEFETSLREYLSNPPDQPEHTECQLCFWIGTSFLVAAPKPSAAQPTPPSQQQPQQQPPPPPAPPRFAQHPDASAGFQSAAALQQYAPPTSPYQSVPDPALALTLATFPPQASPPTAASNGAGGSANTTRKPEQKTSMSILEALQPTQDPKEKMQKQRSIAKCCIDAIQRVDGFRYSFHNCWNSREDDSFRFSYYCNDSLLNKDRAANGKGAKLGKRATKPVYDCKGVLAVKFSATKNTLDVIYKHIPIHKTYEERAPPPRKDSKRRKFLEENDPEALRRIQNRPKPSKVESEPDVIPKPKKKQRSDDSKSSTSLESDLRAQSLRSLLELIRPDPAPEPSPPEPPPQAQLPPPPPQPPATAERGPVQQQQRQQPQPQTQATPQPPRKRLRNSCNSCKQKKTKCDGARPTCQTCVDKKRHCTYPDAEENRRPSAPDTAESVQQAQAVNNELSELEKMKKELEEARARIQELENEQRRSSIPASQTPQMPRHQAQQHPQAQSDAKSQTPSHPQPRQHQQQHSQHPQQTTQQHRQQQQPQQPIQMQNSQPAEAIQQLQTASQLQTPQQISNPQQLQTPQFSHYTNHSTNPYGMSRPMPAQNMSPSISAQNAAHPTQQPQNQMHAANTGLTPTADSAGPYPREFWGYYGYQSAQQHQPDQWAAARNQGVFR